MEQDRSWKDHHRTEKGMAGKYYTKCYKPRQARKGYDKWSSGSLDKTRQDRAIKMDTGQDITVIGRREYHSHGKDRISMSCQGQNITIIRTRGEEQVGRSGCSIAERTGEKYWGKDKLLPP
jgi:phage anti-repressor protein